MKKILTTLSIIILTIAISTGLVLAATGTVNTQALNFREEANTNSNVIQKIDKGKKVNIISEEGDWYKISYNSKEGYVKQEYIDKDTSTTTEKAEETVVKEETSNEENINTENPNQTTIKQITTLYVLPLLNSTNLGLLETGQKVLLISVNGSWAYVQTETKSGWVMASKLEKTEITLTNTKAQNTIQIETNPQTNQTETNTVTTNETNTAVVNETIEQNNITLEEETKITEKTEEVSTTPESSFPKTMYVKAEDVNVRAKADASSTILTSLEKNDKVTVTGKEGNWYKVETEDEKGYIREDLLKETK